MGKVYKKPNDDGSEIQFTIKMPENENPSASTGEIKGYLDARVKFLYDTFGTTKFYTDEFDAFEKYYAKLTDRSDRPYDLHFITPVMHMSYYPYCDLTVEADISCNKTRQNHTFPSMAKTSDSVEFALPCVEMLDTNEKGRHLRTTAPIDKGDIIINEKASVLQIDPQCVCKEKPYNMYRCHHCAYALEKFHVCLGCNIVIYCSISCLIESYHDYHQYECEGLQKHYWDLVNVDYSYLAFRMILYGAKYDYDNEMSEEKKWGSRGNNYPYIYELENNFDKIPLEKVYDVLVKASETVAYLKLKTNFFKRFDANYDGVPYIGGLFVKFYFQAQMNCVLLRYPNFDQGYAIDKIGATGKAICPSIALINHSCTPNAVIIPCNDRILVRAIRDISKNEEITICYQEIDIFFTLEERQVLMRNYFYFDVMCTCNYCIHESVWDEYPYKCSNCLIGRAKKTVLFTGEESLFCRYCKCYSSVNHRDEKLADIAGEIYRKTFKIAPAIKAAQIWENLYPEDSWMLMDINRILFDKYYSLGEKPLETIKYGTKYFKIMELYVSKRYLPALKCKVQSYLGIIETKEFQAIEYVTEEELLSSYKRIDEELNASFETP